VKIAVTGGKGFLGRFVVRELERRGHQVSGLGRRDYDLTEQAAVRKLYADLRPEVLVHLAAAVGGIGANVANPGRFLSENAVMGLMLLEEARLAGVARFVLTSTTCAYPKDAPLPLREDDLWSGPPVGATGPYGMAKRLLHEALAGYAKQYGTKGAVLVLANLYGPEDHFDSESNHVIPALIKRYVEAASAGAPSVTNWGTGTPTREFLHVADAARAIATAAERQDDPIPMNIGTGQETSIADLTRLVAELTGYRGDVTWDTSKPDGQPRRYLDVSRARELLGFTATVPLREGLAETIDWYRSASVGKT
jgi:GDP-L-fucose synthase